MNAYKFGSFVLRRCNLCLCYLVNSYGCMAYFIISKLTVRVKAGKM
jgi:hypothetical protein